MNWKIFNQLMRKDLMQFRRDYRGKFFNTVFLFFTNVMVFGYFMPKVESSNNYGAFILFGAIASFGLFDIIGRVAELIADMDGDRTITFNLMLPLPSWMVFSQIALKWASSSFLLCLPLFVFGKLFLWNEVDISKINFIKLIMIFPTISLFFGFFSLWLSAILTKMGDLSNLFMRVINPLFMFGAYFYSWQDSFALSPIIGYASLFNPMVYAMEGIRAATLGQAGYLPFCVSFLALWVFIIASGTHAIYKLKRRLDVV